MLVNFFKKCLSLILIAVSIIGITSCSGKNNETSTDTGMTSDGPVPLLTEIKNGRISTSDFYSNPHSVSHIGDPFILADGDYYYMYATTTGKEFKCWKSKDCSSWYSVGRVYSISETSFGEKNYWAPEVYKYEGKYYIFYSAGRTMNNGKLRYSIGCAVADSPEGPFTDIIPNNPIYAPDYSVIDANVLFDKSGRIYLYYSRDCSENIVGGKHVSQSYGIELSKDFKSTIGDPVLLTTPDTKWELATGSWIWNEGQCVFERNGIYYLMYSAGTYKNNSYSVGYATSDSPLGTYKKYEDNPILKGDGKTTCGTGHNNYFFSKDGKEMFTVYHSRTEMEAGKGTRQLCIDRISFDQQGNLRISGPSAYSSFALPSGNDLYDIIDESEYTITSEVQTTYGSSELIKNGYIEQNPNKKYTDYWSIKPENKYIDITFDSPKDIKYMLLYWLSKSEDDPWTMSIVINDKYIIKDISVELNDSSKIISFSNLNKNEKIQNLKLYFRSTDDSNIISLKEIVLLENK